MDSSEVKRLAREYGADLVGIAPVARLDSLPPEHHPARFLPEVKTVVAVAHRILRGALRGVEEGTNFGSTYMMYGYHWSESNFLLRTVHGLACRLESEGIESVPLLAGDGVDYKAVARAAGLGDTGLSGFFLTPEYGHRQRFGMVLTDAAFEPDRVRGTGFCDGCDACARACPLGAIHHGPDLALCAQCRNGASAKSAADGVDRYAAACGRACMVALEDKTGNRFTHAFRKRGVWRIGSPREGG